MTGRDELAPPSARPWVALECTLATALALYLAVRLERPSMWLLVPVALLLATGRRLDAYGLELRFTPPGPGGHALLGAGALALYGALHAAAERLLRGARFDLRLPDDVLWLGLSELLVVAVPEEVFFRGYLQSSLDRIFPRRRRVFGAEVGAGLVLQAVVFALCHLTTGDWTRLRVFFFALLAGWLRERSGSVFAPIVYHAAGNVWYAVLASSFR